MKKYGNNYKEYILYNMRPNERTNKQEVKKADKQQLVLLIIKDTTYVVNK